MILIFCVILSVISLYAYSVYDNLQEKNKDFEVYKNRNTGKIAIGYMCDYLIFLP